MQVKKWNFNIFNIRNFSKIKTMFNKLMIINNILDKKLENFLINFKLI